MLAMTNKENWDSGQLLWAITKSVEEPNEKWPVRFQKFCNEESVAPHKEELWGIVAALKNTAAGEILSQQIFWKVEGKSL